jgi:hypothetical protein
MEVYKALELRSICKTAGDNVEDVWRSELCEETLRVHSGDGIALFKSRRMIDTDTGFLLD